MPPGSQGPRQLRSPICSRAERRIAAATRQFLVYTPAPVDPDGTFGRYGSKSSSPSRPRVRAMS